MGEIKDLPQLLNALRRGYTIKDGIILPPVKPHAAHGPEMAGRHFCISIAGHTVGIDSMYAEVYSLCKNYLCNDKPEILVATNNDDILLERDEISNSSDSYLETLSVYRKICESMLQFDVFLMHGAVIADGKSAYMFTAESGTGKTTHIRKWLDKLKNAYVVNGDKPLIRITEKEVIACGTPWCGKEQMETNIMVPLKAIVLMERGEDNSIEEISFRQAFPDLLHQTYRPTGTEQMKKTLKLVSQLNGKVHFFRFVFNNLKNDAFDVAYHAVTGGINETDNKTFR